jgi:hypothetical protein
MHWPDTLLRWRFGPQPPNANAGVTADDRAAESMTTPSSVAESFFMKNLPFPPDNPGLPHMNPEPARILRFSGVPARQAGVAGGYI